MDPEYMSHVSKIPTINLTYSKAKLGGSKRWTFLRNDGHRRTIVTLPSELSAVCIAQN